MTEHGRARRTAEGLYAARRRGRDLRALAGGRRLRARRRGLDAPTPTLPPFTIIQPPPNITGSLHLGHAQRTAVEDLMIRHARMRGHRGALPARPRPRLDRRPVRARRDPRQGGREPPERSAASATSSGCAQFVDDDPRASCSASSGGVGASARLGPPALHDGRGLGEGRPGRLQAPLRRAASPTGPRRSSTGAPAAGPASATSRSIPTPETGTLWTIRYHLIDEATGRARPRRRRSRVATTRPETILGDTAVAVHPDDERYRDLVGRRVRIPFVERDVPIIADDGRRPGVRDGRRQDHAGPRPRRPRDRASATACRCRRSSPTTRRSPSTGTAYDGLDRYEARRRILADLEARGDLGGRDAARDGHRALPALATTSSSRGSRPSGSSGPAPLAARGARGDPRAAGRGSCPSGSRRPGSTG